MSFGAFGYNSRYKIGTKGVFPLGSQLADKRLKCKQISLYLPAHVSLTSSGIFYFRYVFPEPLRIWSRKRELKVSLGRDYGDALQQAWQYNKFVQILKLSWQRSGAVVGVTDEERREIARQIALNMMSGDNNNIGNAYNTHMLSLMSQQSALSLSKSFQEIWASLLKDADPADIRRAGITPDLLHKMKQQLKSQAAPAKKLADVVDDWIDSKKRRGSGDKSLNAYQTTKQELCWAFGKNTDIASLTSDDLKDYGAFWQSEVPLLTYRLKHKLTMRSIKDGKYPTGVSPQTDELLETKTKMNKLLHIRNFFSWCYKQDYLPVDFSLKLQDLGLKEAKNVNTNPPLSDEMIVKLYKAVKKYKDYKIKNTLGDLRYRYWVLLLLLYSGARVGEVCQLLTDDILLPGSLDPSDLNKQRVLSHPCIRFQACDDEKSKKLLKNDSSERCIPIHPILLSAGFLDYVDDRKGMDEKRLFDVSYTTGNGFAGKVSEFYNEILRKEFPNSKSRLKSTRQCVETQFDVIKTGSQEYKIACTITGREIKEENQVRRVYVGRYTPEQMKPIIEMLSYPCIEDLM